MFDSMRQNEISSKIITNMSKSVTVKISEIITVKQERTHLLPE